VYENTISFNMARNYSTTRNKELSYWKKTSKRVLVPSKRDELLAKAQRLGKIFPETKIWRDLHYRIYKNLPLSSRQLAAINNAYQELFQFSL
jgi:predicted DNA binding protein